MNKSSKRASLELFVFRLDAAEDNAEPAKPQYTMHTNGLQNQFVSLKNKRPDQHGKKKVSHTQQLSQTFSQNF